MHYRKPSKAWARNGLSRIKGIRKIDERGLQHTGFSEYDQDPRKQMSWDNFFAKFDRKHRHDDELHMDGGITPFAPFA
jgi:hypothetical protein